jgi:hypothetical protein
MSFGNGSAALDNSGIPRSRRARRFPVRTIGERGGADRSGRGVFGTTPMFWLNLQAQYDLECCRDEIGTELGKTEPVRQKRDRMPPPRHR